MSAPFKLIIGDGTADDAADELEARLWDVVCEFAPRMHPATAIGALELVKAQVVRVALDD